MLELLLVELRANLVTPTVHRKKTLSCLQNKQHTHVLEAKRSKVQPWATTGLRSRDCRLRASHTSRGGGNNRSSAGTVPPCSFRSDGGCACRKAMFCSPGPSFASRVIAHNPYTPAKTHTHAKISSPMYKDTGSQDSLPRCARRVFAQSRDVPSIQTNDPPYAGISQPSCHFFYMAHIFPSHEVAWKCQGDSKRCLE